jgi:hypothetical protein
MTGSICTLKLPPNPPLKWREGQRFKGAFCTSRQISRHFGGIALPGGPAFRSLAMKPPGIPGRTFCPERVVRNPDRL